jgi:hypothetical protein
MTVVKIPQGLREAELVARLREAELLIEKLLLNDELGGRNNYYKAMGLLISIKELIGTQANGKTKSS